METKILKINDPDKQIGKVREVASALALGLIAAVPTETVYGLAANAKDPSAVAEVFRVKGRPQDNPLIVHISSMDELKNVAVDVPREAYILAEKFWPGPLTMVLKRSDQIPDTVSAGLDTVAVRMPSHPVARAIIRESGVPLAAPSANLSGSPSPTTAEHCINDLFSKVPYIVDSGECNVGVESTVISLAFGKPDLLRPGAITPGQLEAALCKSIELDPAVEGEFKGNAASAPGMKYKHYSPKAEVVLVKGRCDRFADFVNDRAGDGVYALCFDEDEKRLRVPEISLGASSDASHQAHELFSALRRLDEMGAKKVFAHCPETNGVGLAVYNRLVRSAAFNIIELK